MYWIVDTVPRAVSGGLLQNVMLSDVRLFRFAPASQLLRPFKLLVELTAEPTMAFHWYDVEYRPTSAGVPAVPRSDWK